MPSEIVIVGVKELEAKIGRMATVKVLTPPMVKTLANLSRWLAYYPPRTKRQAQRAGMSIKAFRMSNSVSTYVRTHKLEQAWRNNANRVVNTDGGGLTGMISNPMPYGPYVMGPGPEKPRQAWMHQGIWNTTDDVADKHQDQIVADFKAAIDGALK